MKRTDFETRLSQLGLDLTAYGNGAYYGACEQWSLSLQPFPSDEVKQAKLAISAPPSERAVIVDTFLSAARVTKTAQITQALEAGGDFRGSVGPKLVSMTSIGSELVLNVIE